MWSFPAAPLRLPLQLYLSYITRRLHEYSRQADQLHQGTKIGFLQSDGHRHIFYAVFLSSCFLNWLFFSSCVNNKKAVRHKTELQFKKIQQLLFKAECFTSDPFSSLCGQRGPNKLTCQTVSQPERNPLILIILITCNTVMQPKVINQQHIGLALHRRP